MRSAWDELSAGRRGGGCLSELALERIVGGELGRGVEVAHLAGCEACARRRAQLEREDQELEPLLAWEARRLARTLGVTPPRQTAVRGGPRARSGLRRRVGGLAVGGVALAMAAILVLLVVPPRGGPTGPHASRAPGGEVRRKGGFALDLIARHAGDGRVGLVLPGDRLRPGDALRFRVRAARAGHLVVVALDPGREVTLYAPVRPGAAQAIGAGPARLLDGSIVLDPGGGPERVVAVLCPGPLATAEVVAAARRALADAGDDPRRVSPLAVARALEHPRCAAASVWFQREER